MESNHPSIPSLFGFRALFARTSPLPAGDGVFSIGTRGFFGSRDPFPTHQTIAFVPKTLKEAQDIFGHFQEKRSRVTHHFSGHLIDLPGVAPN
jgi:hypothetical protein